MKLVVQLLAKMFQEFMERFSDIEDRLDSLSSDVKELKKAKEKGDG